MPITIPKNLTVTQTIQYIIGEDKAINKEEAEALLFYVNSVEEIPSNEDAIRLYNAKQMAENYLNCGDTAFLRYCCKEAWKAMKSFAQDSYEQICQWFSSQKSDICAKK